MVRSEILEKIKALARQPEKIRNIAVIAHVDHGKTTVTDSLVGSAGLLNDAKVGSARVMDSDKHEKEKGITIKSCAISLPLERTRVVHRPHYNPNWPEPAPPASPEPEAVHESFLVNVIDSPGHVDFSSEVTAALRVTDGALVVVDCVEGVCVQTRTVLRQALSERIRPVLFLNKLDRVLLEQRKDPEEAYLALRSAIESVNVVIGTYEEKDGPMGDVTVWPQTPTVGFGSGLHGWAFTLEHFAEIWHEQFHMAKKKMMKKLWGEHYFDTKTKQWVTEQFTKSGRRRPRGFTMLVMEPLKKLFDAILAQDTVVADKIRAKLRIPTPPASDVSVPKDHLKAVMRTWLPIGACLRDLIVDHLPSPVQAQAYRAECVYGGQGDEASAGIQACNADAGLMIYISKMVPDADKKRFFAFGRVFSGTVKPGMTVRVLGPNYSPENKDHDSYEVRVTNTKFMMGPSVEQAGDVPCGNLIGLVGVDKYIKRGTITTVTNADKFLDMSFQVAPVVRVAVQPRNPADLNKLLKGLNLLGKSDPLVQVSTSPTGEHIIAGCGELHMELCRTYLTEEYAMCPLEFSDPVVTFQEGITRPSEHTVLAKSPNKHNRLHMSAEPLSEELCTALERGNLSQAKDKRKALTANHGWTTAEARKLWSFGCPPDSVANMLVDSTRGVAYLHDIKDSISSAFQSATMEGVFAREPMRGIRFNVEDAKVHADAPHRGVAQITPCTRAALYACQLVSGPCLYEPMYRCDIVVDRDKVEGVYSTLRQRRATIGIDDELEDDLPGVLTVISAYLPVQESFGFTELLRKNTSGRATPTLAFSHWAQIPGDIDDPTSLVRKTLDAIRARKGLSPELPKLSDYHTRM